MKKDYIKHILYSGIIGVVFWIIGELLYDLLTKKIWQPIGIALYFFVFAIIMIVGMYILAVFRGDYNKAVNKGIKPISNNIGTIILLLIIFFVSTGVLELLYELGGESVISEPTSYVFLIDDSGSMSGNDPNCERATAIKKIMEKKEQNFPYAVYSFTSESQLVKEMGLYSQDDDYQFNSNGGTNIIGSLNSVIDEVIVNKDMCGDCPRIMLVSDGSSSSFGSNSVIQKCNNNGISISSISFGNIFGNSLLNKLATRTGGVYVDAGNVDDLSDKMQNAITANATRNLISERYMPKLNWLYAILRIIFLVIMSVLWSLIKNIAYCGNKREKNEENYSYDNVVLFTVVLALISILIMEFGMAYINFPEKLTRFILAVLWTIVPGKFYIASNKIANLTGVRTGNSDFYSDIDNKTLQDSKHKIRDEKKTLDAGGAFKKPAEGFEHKPSGFKKASGMGGFSGGKAFDSKSSNFGKNSNPKSNSFENKSYRGGFKKN